MQVINIRSKIGSDGCLHLDIPVEYHAGEDIEAVVVISSSKKRQPYEFSDLAGKLKWKGNAVETQKKLRHEW